MSSGDKFDARGRSPGFELFQELPDFGELTGGPWRAHAYAGDFRVASRSPRALITGTEPAIHQARYRQPAIVCDDAANAASYVTTPGDVYTRPTDSSEALQWKEVANVFAAPSPVLPRSADGFAVQLLAVSVPGWAAVVVERVATYLDVQALDDEGAPIGDRFRTAEFCCSDPFPVFVHPTSGTTLRFRWTLAGAHDDDPELPTGSPSSSVPTDAIQILPHWEDLRFAWGSRYTEDLQLLVPASRTSVRLYCTIIEDSDPSNWRIRVGGRLGLWWIGGGPRGAALAASSRRT